MYSVSDVYLCTYKGGIGTYTVVFVPKQICILYVTYKANLYVDL